MQHAGLWAFQKGKSLFSKPLRPFCATGLLIVVLAYSPVAVGQNGRCPQTQIELQMVRLQDTLRQTEPQVLLPTAGLGFVLVLPTTADTTQCAKRPVWGRKPLGRKPVLTTPVPMPRPLLLGVEYDGQRMAVVLPGSNPAGYALGKLPFLPGGVFVFKYFDFWDTGRNTRQNLLDVLQHEPVQRYQPIEHLQATPAEDLLTTAHLQALQRWVQHQPQPAWPFTPMNQRHR